MRLLYTVEDYERFTGKAFPTTYPKIETLSPPLRKAMNKKVKALIWDKTKGHCYHCNAALNPFANFHIDHLIPLSKGGADTLENCVPSCAKCNLRKGNRNVN